MKFFHAEPCIAKATTPKGGFFFGGGHTMGMKNFAAKGGILDIIYCSVY